MLIVISTIPAWIVTYFFMNKWLQNFHYHITLQLLGIHPVIL